MSQVTARVWRNVAALFVAMVPVSASAQVGRIFVTAEAFVGLSRVVYVGKIADLEQIEYDEPLTSTQELGKPHRLVLEVSQTIRGADVKRLELVLSLQSTFDLEFMRDHSVVVMLVGGPTRLRSSPGDKVGIEEQGRRVDGEWYQFRLLDPVELPASDDEAAIASQINKSCDSCRMFTNELEIIVGSRAILKRARAFAGKYPKILPPVTLRVPNEFGALCGDPNAYCMITLPVCPETEATLRAINEDPSLILSRIESRDENYNRSLLRTEVNNALKVFSDASSK